MPSKLAITTEIKALKQMKASMVSAIDQISDFDDKLIGTLKVSCKNAGITMARIAAGQIDESQAKFALVESVAQDLGHDITFGFNNKAATTPISKPLIEQPVTLVENSSWQVLVDSLHEAILYSNVKIAALEGANLSNVESRQKLPQGAEGAMSQVKFKWSSSDIEHFNLRIQQADNETFELTMSTNPQTFSLTKGTRYIYMLKVRGNSGSKCKLEIERASDVRSPINRTIVSGFNRDTFLNDFIA